VQAKVDNKTAYFYTGGKKIEKGKKTIIFIHGAANDHSVWALQSRYFAWHGWNVLAVDLPGHGKSEGPPLNSIQELSSWVYRVANSTEISNASIVGHSMGSLIALELASSQPQFVTNISLVGTANPMPVSETLLESSRTTPQKAYDLIVNFAHSNRAKLGTNPVPGMWMTESSRRLMETMSDGVLFADFVACNTYDQGEVSAKKVTCPALLILGREDRMTPIKLAAKLQSDIQNTHTESLPGAGHALMAEQPGLVLNHLRDFLK